MLVFCISLLHKLEHLYLQTKYQFSGEKTNIYRAFRFFVLNFIFEHTLRPFTRPILEV